MQEEEDTLKLDSLKECAKAVEADKLVAESEKICGHLIANADGMLKRLAQPDDFLNSDAQFRCAAEEPGVAKRLQELDMKRDLLPAIKTDAKDIRDIIDTWRQIQVEEKQMKEAAKEANKLPTANKLMVVYYHQKNSISLRGTDTRIIPTDRLSDTIAVVYMPITEGDDRIEILDI